MWKTGYSMPTGFDASQEYASTLGTGRLWERRNASVAASLATAYCVVYRCRKAERNPGKHSVTVAKSGLENSTEAALAIFTTESSSDNGRLTDWPSKGVNVKGKSLFASTKLHVESAVRVR